MQTTTEAPRASWLFEVVRRALSPRFDQGRRLGAFTRPTTPQDAKKTPSGRRARDHYRGIVRDPHDIYLA